MPEGEFLLSEGRPPAANLSAGQPPGLATSSSASSRPRFNPESRNADEEEVIPAACPATASSPSSANPRAHSTVDREVEDWSMLNGAGLSAGEVDGIKIPENTADVWLHIYHCDPYTGFLNRHLLKNAEIGIYHAGVEIYGEEWSFQYFEDTWDDPSVSGLIRCVPKHMTDYEYQESINLGPTPLSEEEVDQILVTLQYEWPACSYHLTHNNCLTFAEHFAKKLQAPADFPMWLKGILDASQKNQSVDAIVDYSWSWVKWFMVRKHRQADEEIQATTEVANDASRLGFWVLLQPGYACSGNALCPAHGGLRRAGPDSTNGNGSDTNLTIERPLDMR